MVPASRPAFPCQEVPEPAGRSSAGSAGVAVLEAGEILERLSEQARGRLPTRVTQAPELERREYDMLRALVELRNILGLSQQDAPALHAHGSAQ